MSFFTKEKVGGFVVGVCVIVTIFVVWLMWETNKIAVDAQTKANQIISLINSSQQQPEAVKK